MARYTISRTICPRCGKTINAGKRYFGPSKVVCGHCRSEITTGLSAWSTLSTGRKVFIVIGEMFWPSFMGLTRLNGVVPGLLLIVAMVGLPMAAVVGIAYGIAAPFGGLTGEAIGYVTIVGLLVYPAFLTRRIVMMIRESNAYTRTGVPPVRKQRRSKAPSRKPI